MASVGLISARALPRPRLIRRLSGPGLGTDRIGLAAGLVFAGVALSIPFFELESSWSAIGPWADFLVLLGLAALSSLRPLGGEGHHARPMGGGIAICAAVFTIGPGAGVWVGLLAVTFGWFQLRYRRRWLWAELIICAWVPLIIGAAFYGAVELLDLKRSGTEYVLLIAAALLLGYGAYLAIIAGYERWVAGQRFWPAVKRTLYGGGLEAFAVAATLTIVISFIALHRGAIGLLLACALIVIGQWGWYTTQTLANQVQAWRTRSQQLTSMQFALIRALIETIHLRDATAADHAAHTAAFARALAAKMGLSQREQYLAHAAGVLHDIGKYGFPDELFDVPPERLDQEGWQIIKRHPSDGAAIVSQLSGYAEVAEIIATHHERPDGSGYPRGLRGTDVPMLAQIVGLCEAYDTMIRGSLYRPPMTPETALRDLQREEHVDPRLLEAFRELLAERGADYRYARFTDFNRELRLAEGFMRTL